MTLCVLAPVQLLMLLGTSLADFVLLTLHLKIEMIKTCPLPFGELMRSSGWNSEQKGEDSSAVRGWPVSCGARLQQVRTRRPPEFRFVATRRTGVPWSKSRMPESHRRGARGTACIGWVQHENRVWEFINQFHTLSLVKESAEPTQQPTKYKNHNHLVLLSYSHQIPSA